MLCTHDFFGRQTASKLTVIKGLYLIFLQIVELLKQKKELMSMQFEYSLLCSNKRCLKAPFILPAHKKLIIISRYKIKTVFHNFSSHIEM